MITSAEIKFIKSLSQKKFRDSSGLFVAEGEKLVAEALSSRFEVEKVYRKEEIGEAAMARITGLSSPSPALALIHKPEDLSKGQVPEKGLFLALDGIRDPGNLGTILRVAALCKGVTARSGKVYGTFLDGENFYARELSNGPDSPSLIVIGNEANGITEKTAACVTDRLYIPPFPADDAGSESLNAAVATAITVAEFRRRLF